VLSRRLGCVAALLLPPPWWSQRSRFAFRSYFWLILIQFLLELGLFIAAAIMVRWPQPALVRNKELSTCVR
jgi:hypothetical protein